MPIPTVNQTLSDIADQQKTSSQIATPRPTSHLPRAEGSPLGLRLEGVMKYFGQVGAANGVDLEVRSGELLALLGPSGCGKTTTLRLIAGFEMVDAGTIEIGGQQVAGPYFHLPPERRRVGMVFQEYALFPHLNVWDNVGFGLRHMDPAARRQRIGEVLELVGLSALARRMPHELSGGQQQRVALARALAPNPALILLDEPFSNLDAGLRVRVRAEVRAILKQARATAVFVTHDQEEALSLVDRVAVMLHGRIHQVDAPQALYRQPISREVAAFIGDANFLPGHAHGRTAECELGTVDLLVPAQGPVDLMIRPENLAIHPAPPSPQAHRVQDQLFFGHDQLVRVRLATGRTVDVRLGPAYPFAHGQPVAIRITAPVMAYPRDAQE